MTDVRRPVLDTAAGQPDVALQVEPVDASPGQPTTARCELTNRGAAAASYSLSVIGFEEGWIEVPAVVGPIAPGATIQLALKVNVPEGYPASTIVGVVCCGPAGAEPVVSADLAITVGDANQVYAALEPEEAVGWRGARIAIVLRNRGTSPTRVELSAVVPEKRLRVRFKHKTPVLPPGKELRVRAEVRALHHLSGDPRRRPYGVKVQGRSAPVLLDGAFLQRPLLSAHVMKVVALVAVAALWITAAVFGIGALSNHLQKNATSQAVASAPPIAPPVAPKSGSGSSTISPSGPHGSAPGKLGSGSVRVGGKVSGASPGGVLVTISPTSLADPSTDGAVPVSTNATLTSAVTSNVPLPADVPDGKVYGTMLGSTVDAGLTADAGQPAIGTKTSPDGAWAIAGLQAPATYLVTFSKPGYSTQKYLLTTTTGGTVMTVNATINPGVGYISGTIDGPLGGLGGVEVTITDGTVTLSTLTPSVGSNVGSWALSGLTTPDTYLVTATKAGYGTETTIVSLQASGTASGVTLRLRPGVGSISGTVVNTAAAVGIGGVTVTATNGSMSESATTTTVGKVGSYLLPNLPIPGTYALTVSGNGFVTQTQKVKLAGNAVLDASLVSAGADVLGFAYAAGRVGLGAAGVTLTNGTVTFKTLTQSTTPVGSFTFSQVPAGVYVLTVSDYGYAPASAQVIVSPGQVTTKSLILHTAAAASLNTGTIQGTVVDLFDAQGLTGVPVLLDGGPGATSGTNGTYQINDVSPGVHTLSASEPGFEPASVQVDVPLGGIAFAPQLSLPKLDGIAGTVTSATGKGTISGATVTLYGSTATVPPQTPSAIVTTTTLTGTATTTTLTGTATTTTLAGSTTTTTLAGSTTTTTALPGGNTTGTATTNASGQYDLADIAHGNYQLLVSAPGYVSQVLTVSLAPDQSLTENVTLSLVPNFQVAVYTASGGSGTVETAGVCVTVTGADFSSTELSSSTGPITFSPLVAGQSYTVSFWQPSSTAGSSAVSGVPASPCPQDNAEVGTAPSYTFVAQYNNTSIYSAFVASQLPAVTVDLYYQYEEQATSGSNAVTVDCPVATVGGGTPVLPSGVTSAPEACPTVSALPAVSLTGITGFGASSNGNLGNPIYSSAISATAPTGTDSSTWTFSASSLSALISGQITLQVNGSSTPFETISPTVNYTTGTASYTFILTPTPVDVTGTVSSGSATASIAVNPDVIPVSPEQNGLNPASITVSNQSGTLSWGDSQVGAAGLAQPGTYTLTATATGFVAASQTIDVGVVAGVLTGAATSVTLTLTQAPSLKVAVSGWSSLASSLADPTVSLFYDGALVSSSNGGPVTVTNSGGTTTDSSSLLLSSGSDTATFAYLVDTATGYTVVVTAPGYETYFHNVATLSAGLNTVTASLVQDAVITGTATGTINDPDSSGPVSSPLSGDTITASDTGSTCPSLPADALAGDSDTSPSTLSTTAASDGSYTLATTPSAAAGSNVNGGFCPGGTFSVSTTAAGYSGSATTTSGGSSTLSAGANTVDLAVQASAQTQKIIVEAGSAGAGLSFTTSDLPTVSASSSDNAQVLCQDGGSHTNDSAAEGDGSAETSVEFDLSVYPATYYYTISAPGFNTLYLNGISYAAGVVPTTRTVYLQPQTSQVTGTVTINGTPVPQNVKMDLYYSTGQQVTNSGTAVTATTDSSGVYSFPSVAANETYYVAPDPSTGYEVPTPTYFSPSYNTSVTNENVAIEAVPPTTIDVSVTSTAPDSNVDGTTATLNPIANPGSLACLNTNSATLLRSGLGQTYTTTISPGGGGEQAAFTDVVPDYYALTVSGGTVPAQTATDVEVCPSTSASTPVSTIFQVQEGEVTGTLTLDTASSTTPTVTVTPTSSGQASTPTVNCGTTPSTSCTYVAYANLGDTYTVAASLSGYLTTPTSSSWSPTTGSPSATDNFSLGELPGAPSGLSASGQPLAVALSWSAPSSGGTVSSYSIYEGTSSNHEGSTAVATGVSGTSDTISNLTANKTYYFTVKAVNAVGSSGASNEASATAQAATVPGAPTTLTATAETNGTSVDLSWTAPSSNGGESISGYDVYDGTSSGGEAGAVNGSEITGTTYTVTSLTPGTTYYFTVKAINSVGHSTASNEASATTPSAPDAPTGLAATAEPNGTSVDLQWSAPTGGGAVSSYDVYQGTSTGHEGASPVATGISGTTTTITGLTANTTYYFTVEAVNAVGNSPASNEASATTLTAPGAPTGLGATAQPDGTSILLQWTAPTTGGPASSYDVYQGTSTGHEGASPVATGVSGTSTTITGLTPGDTYYFTVEAVNAAGSSPASGETSATTPTAPAAPTNLTATASTVTTGKIDLSWDASSGATSYDVYRGTSSGGESLVASSVSGTTYSDTGLTSTTTYYYYVKAVNGVGPSGESNEVFATAP